MKELVLLNMDTTGEEGHPPLGLCYIASYLKKYMNFDNVAIVDKEKENTFKVIKSHKPNIVGISSVTCEFNKAMKLAEKIKTELNIPVIVGGSHITPIPHSLPNVFDIAVLGEGEETMLELMRVYESCGGFPTDKLKEIQGIAFYENGRVIINQRRPWIEPLDKIPYPDRDLLKMEEYYLTPRRTISNKKLSRGTHMLTSRGCPYRCVFCASSNFWQRLRCFSPEYVVEEIRQLVEKYNVDGMVILDDLFTADKKRLEKIVELLKKEKLNDKLEFRILSRVNLIIDEEICKLLKEMNVIDVSLGFESASPKVLSYLKKNTTTVEQNMKAIQTSKKYGFRIHGYLMVGSPIETKEDMMMTINFIKNNPISTIDLCITTPLPGTELWEYAKQRGLVSDDMDWDNLVLKNEKNNILVIEKMTRKEFFELYEIAKKEVEKKNFSLDFRFSNLLSTNLLKRGLMHPYKSFKILKYSLGKKLGF